MDKIDACTVAAVPIVPFVLWDYDLAPDEDTPTAAWTLRRFATVLEQDWENEPHRHWKTRLTKNGLHLVIRCETWDEAQAKLYDLLHTTHKNSIMSCRKQRLRISAKWDLATGAIVNQAPVDLDGCGHWDKVDIVNDRKLTRLEFYKTFERTKDTRQWKDGELYLASRGEQIG